MKYLGARRFTAAIVALAMTGCSNGFTSADYSTTSSSSAMEFSKSAFDTNITHGSQLTLSMVGPAGLGVATSQLRTVNPGGERIGTWSDQGLPSWIPNAPY